MQYAMFSFSWKVLQWALLVPIWVPLFYVHLPMNKNIHDLQWFYPSWKENVVYVDTSFLKPHLLLLCVLCMTMIRW